MHRKCLNIGHFHCFAIPNQILYIARVRKKIRTFDFGYLWIQNQFYINKWSLVDVQIKDLEVQLGARLVMTMKHDVKIGQK